MTTNYDFDFIEYCWSFYGPGQVHGDFFDNALTRKELEAATEEYMLTNTADFAADSFDREHIRDIMLVNRNKEAIGI